MGDGIRNHSLTHESCQRCINDTAMLPSWLGKGSLKTEILVPVTRLVLTTLKNKRIFVSIVIDLSLSCPIGHMSLITKDMEEVFQALPRHFQSSMKILTLLIKKPFHCQTKASRYKFITKSSTTLTTIVVTVAGDSLDDIYCPTSTFWLVLTIFQPAPPQYTVNHPIFNSQNEFLNSQNELLNSSNKLMEQMTSMCDMVGQFIQKKEEEKRIEEEQAAKDRYWKIPVCYDDDDDEESSIPLKDIISELPPCVAITPDSPKTNSLIMEDEHLDTIPETESDELIKSSVEDLVQIPSESEDSFEGECDLPPYDDSSKNHDLTFSNPLFDANDDDASSDEEEFKISSNPLFKSLLNRDTSFDSSSKIDFLLDEFAGELTRLQSIPPGIDNINLDPEGDILFLESLLYDNSSPRPPEEF
ncbi:hypothetical protein Tco_1474607 [Tanacetum coccineum]